MTPEALIARTPRLFHVAEPSAWAAIEAVGLLCASDLLDLHEVTGTRREAIEARPRPDSVVLDSPGRPRAILRDQRPLLPLRDEHLLDGLNVSDWCRILNGRVFFFTTKEEADRLVAAYPGHQVRSLSTAAFVERYGDRIELAEINTGYAMRRPVLRGLGTFKSITDFDGRRIAEFTVRGSVPILRELVVAS